MSHLHYKSAMNPIQLMHKCPRPKRGTEQEKSQITLKEIKIDKSHFQKV